MALGAGSKPILPERSPQGRAAFTLLELMVVVAMIALLISLLVPGLGAAREQARAASCAGHLRQLGVAGAAYSNTERGWIVGSPNTSGNGARPGFSAAPYTGDRDHFPALHVFDWANPLLPLMGQRPADDFQRRYRGAVEGVFRCPSNRRVAGPVNFGSLEALIPADVPAPSYATSRYFLYVGRGAVTGQTRGRLWWNAAGIPTGYVPRIERLRNPARKAFLADAHVVSKTKGQIANANWGFTSHGAWRWQDVAPSTYRGEFLRREMWRHGGAINLLAFDGHVERQGEGDSRAANGLGTQARRVGWWFPSGTNTAKLSGKSGKEAALIVP